MSTERPLEARVTLIEENLLRIEKNVAEVVNLIREQEREPRAVPFKEIVLTVGATLTVFYGVLRFIDERYDAAVRPVRDVVTRHEAEMSRLRPLVYGRHHLSKQELLDAR